MGLAYQCNAYWNVSLHQICLALYDQTKKWQNYKHLSVNGLIGMKFKSAYVSAKHGVIGFTKTLALEMAEHNITANAICPSFVRTPLVDKQIDDQAMAHGILREEVIEKVILAEAPMKRLLEPEEIADLAVYLASDSARSITGAAITIDEGWTAQ